MSYLVLARKWRPKSFDTMVAQAHVIGALKNALENQRLHHAYLFTGTRGVGKTTVARIFAKALNCERGVSAHPCGQCASCLSIDEGKFPDLIEVDAASRTGVDDTRDLLDNVQYAPAMGRFKIYLIDEVHMFSKSSFNALLKTLEEPPEHVKFILATTDPQKLPITVLSRCLQFNLKRIDAQQMADHLAYVLTQEQIPFDAEATRLVAWAADGSLRDALSLLDQAIAYSGGQVTEAQVRSMLGLTSTASMMALLQALFRGEFSEVYAAVEQLTTMVSDVEALLADLIEQLHHIAMVQQLGPQGARGLPQAQDWQALAEQISPQDLQLYYQIALKGRSELNLAPRPLQAFEMLMLRMVAFRPLEVALKKNNPVRSLEHPAKALSLPVGRPLAPAKTTAAAPIHHPSSESSKLVSASSDESLPPWQVDEPAPARLDEETPPSRSAHASAMIEAMRAVLEEDAPLQKPASSVVAAAPPKILPTAPSPVEHPSEPDLVQKPLPEPPMAERWSAEGLDWTKWVAQSNLSGGAAVLAKHAEFKGVEGQRFKLAASATNQGIDQEAWRADLQAAIARDFGASWQVDLSWFDGESEQSPFAHQARALEDQKNQVIEALNHREDVRMIREALTLELDVDAITFNSKPSTSIRSDDVR